MGYLFYEMMGFGDAMACNRTVYQRNSHPGSIVTASNLNCFKNRLYNFYCRFILFDFCQFLCLILLYQTIFWASVSAKNVCLPSQTNVAEFRFLLLFILCLK